MAQRGRTEDGAQSLEFDEADRDRLALYGTVVESIARAFGPSCEVVLHSLEDVSRSVVKIENSHVTGRSIGAPITDLGLQLIKKAKEDGCDVIGPYFTKSADHTLRSVSVILRNERGVPIGFLCINMDLSVPFVDLARSLLSPAPASPDHGAVPPAGTAEPVEHFPTSVKDLVRQALLSAPSLSGPDRNRSAVEELNAMDIFRIKGAVEIAAEELGISKHTVYYYLRELRNKNPCDE